MCGCTILFESYIDYRLDDKNWDVLGNGSQRLQHLCQKIFETNLVQPVQKISFDVSSPS